MIDPKKNTPVNVKSPCVNDCCLDLQDVCLGCYRHLKEITGWHNKSNNEKEKILVLCQQRKNTNR